MLTQPLIAAAKTVSREILEGNRAFNGASITEGICNLALTKMNVNVLFELCRSDL
jgi:hypothetical protein